MRRSIYLFACRLFDRSVCLSACLSVGELTCLSFCLCPYSAYSAYRCLVGSHITTHRIQLQCKRQVWEIHSKPAAACWRHKCSQTWDTSHLPSLVKWGDRRTCIALAAKLRHQRHSASLGTCNCLETDSDTRGNHHASVSRAGRKLP